MALTYILSIIELKLLNSIIPDWKIVFILGLCSMLYNIQHKISMSIFELCQVGLLLSYEL